MCKLVCGSVVLCALVIVTVPGVAIPASAATPVPTPLPPPTPIATAVRPVDGAVMVYVPAGEFLMGSPTGSGEHNERPQHSVYLDAYWIDQTEVTNHQFEAFAEDTGYRTDAEQAGFGRVIVRSLVESDTVAGADWRHPEGPDSDLTDRMDYPVVHMSSNDARAYCEWAGAYLPTEAEWEKAARGVDGRRYPWGDERPSCEYAVMQDTDAVAGCGREKPWPVGSKPNGASPYGALDMSGNACEIVSDWYDARYYRDSPAANPQGPDDGTEVTWRGGDFTDPFSGLRCASRGHDMSDAIDNLSGFRCAVAESDLAVPVATSSKPAEDTVGSLLFVGDCQSRWLGTYFLRFAASSTPPTEFESLVIAQDGTSLSDFWENTRLRPNSRDEAQSGKWNLLVLEEDVDMDSPERDEFVEYAGKFNEAIKQGGGRTVLVMIWPRKGVDPSVWDDIVASYTEIGADLGASVAPVAVAFQRALRERPDLEIYGTDRHHAGEHGYYLMMCVLYATIFDRSPVDLSYRMSDADKRPGEHFHWDKEISDDAAAYLQQLAWDTVTEYRAQAGTQ